jgi:hypothetical protein
MSHHGVCLWAGPTQKKIKKKKKKKKNKRCDVLSSSFLNLLELDWFHKLNKE